MFVLIEQIEGHLSWLGIIALICTLMLVLMLRHMATLIRSSRCLHAIIPVDDAVTIHVAIGRWIAVLVVIHGACHMIHYGVDANGKYILYYLEALKYLSNVS
jgi:hypothetical protein